MATLKEIKGLFLKIYFLENLLKVDKEGCILIYVTRWFLCTHFNTNLIYIIFSCSFSSSRRSFRSFCNTYSAWHSHRCPCTSAEASYTRGTPGPRPARRSPAAASPWRRSPRSRCIRAGLKRRTRSSNSGGRDTDREVLLSSPTCNFLWRICRPPRSPLCGGEPAPGRSFSEGGEHGSVNDALVLVWGQNSPRRETLSSIRPPADLKSFDIES